MRSNSFILHFKMAGDVKRFFRGSFFLILTNFSLLIAFFALSWLLIRQNEVLGDFRESQESYDLVILGSSHGESFSRGPNRSLIENILEKKICNLSQGQGGGIIPAKIRYAHFLRKHSAQKVIYFIDPFVFYSPEWNEKQDFSSEPLELDVFIDLLKNRVDIFRYFKSKLSKLVLGAMNHFLKPQNITPRVNSNHISSLTKVDPELVRQNFRVLYRDGVNSRFIDQYGRELELIIQMAKARGEEIVFISYPTLLGKVPGFDEMKSLLLKFEQRYNTKYYDFSEAIHEPKYFEDHHHLNSLGIGYFTKGYLKPLLKNKGNA